ncbi:MAG: ABC transporter ATP-binding protein [Coriobacteriia bacterium]|nr:ABC transporter ATP-binding protein [Coriobacteriia bacterium]
MDDKSTLVGATDAKSTLTIKELRKTFAGLVAVDDVSLSLQTGEIVGLIGPNGSGKTTLINIVTGLLDKDSGFVDIDGFDISALPAHRVARAGLVRTYQTIRLFKNLTCQENVVVGAISVGISQREANSLATQLLDEMGLAERANELASRLTFRDQRLLEIARALAGRPKFILLDEPAAGLNEEESDQLLALLRPMPEAKGVGILVVDHDMRLMMQLCDRLHVLNYGRTIAAGVPEEVRANPEVIKAYLGSEA